MNKFNGHDMKNKMLRKIHFVYALAHPKTDKYFYIGEGLKNRMTTHWETFMKYGWRFCRNSYQYKVFQELKNLGVEPVIKILFKNITKAKSLALEQGLINKYGCLFDGSGILTNLLKNSISNPVGSFEVRNKISNTLKNFFKTKAGKQIRLKQRNIVYELYNGEDGVINRKKMSEKCKVYANSEEGKIFYSKVGERIKNRLKNTIVINNGKIHKYINKNSKIPLGWVLGRLTKGKKNGKFKNKNQNLC